MLDVWRQLQQFLPNRGRAMMAISSVESFLAGLLEAMLIVFVVGVALAIAEGRETVEASIPVVQQGDWEIRSALVIAACAGVVTLLLHFHLSSLNARLSSGVLRSIRERLVTSFVEASWARQAKDREGALQETASTLAFQSAIATSILTTLIMQLLSFGALAAIAVAVDPVVTVVVLGFGAVMFSVFRPLGWAIKRQSGTFVSKNSAFTERITEWGGMAMEHRLFGVAAAEADAVMHEGADVAAAHSRSRFLTIFGSGLFRDLALLFLVGAVASLRSIDDVELVAVGTVVLLIVRSLGYAQGANSALQTVNQLAPNLESVIKRLDSLAGERQCFGSLQVDRVGPVRFDAVSYSYEPGRPAIEDVSAEIRPGEAVGIIGPSGGGKSTLVQVLLRLRPPTAGRVVAGDVNYLEIDEACCARLSALVPQSAHLFEGTVRENIRFHRPHISDERVEQATSDAHVHDEILRLPEGYETILGPRGAGLSGGQTQRIAIARALAGDPKLLVLDEPTSALDVRSEHLFKETIEELKGRVTMVIVAHRLTTLSCCDRVIAMADGRIRAIGTLEEALAHVSLDDVTVQPT